MTTALPTRLAGFAALLQYLNSVTNGWFGPLLLLTTFLCSLLALRGQNPEINFATSSLITLFLAVLLAALQVVVWQFVLATFGLTIISFAVMRAKAGSIF